MLTTVALLAGILATDPATQADHKPQLPEPVRLGEIQRIYIEPFEDGFEQYLIAEISKKFRGVNPPVRVVLDPELADVTLRGVSEFRKGTGAAITGRWLGLHDRATASIALVDTKAKVVLWSNEAGDRDLWWGALARGGPRKVASRLAEKLKKVILKDRKRMRKR